MTDIKLTAFGKNDIRGIYKDDVTEELFYFVGRGFVDFLIKNTDLQAKELWITVSQDARLSSESLAKSLIRGITSMGANVINLGLVPTPLGYFSEFVQYPREISFGAKVNAALIVTASHNPPEYNGLKLTFNKSSLSEEQINIVKEFTSDHIKNSSNAYRWGLCKSFDIIPMYIDKLSSYFGNIGKNIKVVVDSANATGGIVAPRLYREIGCDVIELYSNPDGNFPNHHPNPSDESTLNDLKQKVVEVNADIGIAFDGDSDRIGIVLPTGESITGDKLLLIYSLDVIEDLVKRGEKPVVVSEVKCSQVLYDTINNKGASAIMCKTGHGYIKSMMKEKNAILAGEMSGHIFFKDRYYGFDDAIYAGLRIIEIIAKYKKSDPDFKLNSLLEPFNKVFCSKEIRYKCSNDLKLKVLNDLKSKINNDKTLFQSEIKDIITLDGMRIVFDGGFALIRQSNTEPVFTLRFEACNEDICKNYENIMLDLLSNCIDNYK